MKTRLSLCLILICLFSVCNRAQVITSATYTVDHRIPSYIKISTSEKNIKKGKRYDSSNLIKNILELNEQTTAVLSDTLTDIAGGFHESYKEYFKGIEVDGTRCTVHYDRSGEIKSINGNFRTIELENTSPLIDQETAFDAAKSFIKEKHNIENMTILSIKAADLVVLCKDSVSYLAYRFRIDANEADAHCIVFVDAQAGDVLEYRNTVCNLSANVQTRFSGIQTIEHEYVSGRYRLRDYTRGKGIETYKVNSSNDYTSTDPTWNNLNIYDRAALDAHWGIEKTYDFYRDKFGRNSYDNQGGKIFSLVYYPLLNNAQWGNDHIEFGYTEQYIPLVSLDITAHELTHAVTQYTSWLIYQGESGALNEGISDAFAACVENEYKPSANGNIWKIGEDVMFLRDMSKPDCQYYHGAGWQSTSDLTLNNDYGGVHTNSGVFNYWFYLLAHGKSEGISYPVTGIGLDKAIKICYLMNASYLTSNSTFADACRCSYLAAEALGYDDLYPQIFKAWVNVGVERALAISGQEVIKDSATYEITNLPEGWTVAWSMDRTASGVELLHNYPSNNQCMIRLAPSTLFSDTLRAIIYYGDKEFDRLQKAVRSPIPAFFAFYSQPSSTSNPEVRGVITSATLGQICYVYGNTPVMLHSPFFSGLLVYPITPRAYIQSLGKTDDTTIQFSIASNSTYPLIFQVGTKDGSERFLFNFDLIKRNYKLIAVPSSSGYELRITDEANNISSDMMSQSRLLVEPQWEYSVTNVRTGRQVARDQVDGFTSIVSTAGWEKGIYVVSAKINDKDYSLKILVQ